MRTALVPLLLLLPAIAPAAESRFLFEPNRGQTDASVKYLARGPQGAVFFTENALVFQGVRVEFAEAVEGAWEGGEPASETISYYKGRDAARWVRDLPRYGRLVRRHLYPGIDAVWYGTEGRLEYDFLLAPHADPSRIRLRIPGATRITLEADGSLAVVTPVGELRQRKPRLFQAEHEVAGAFCQVGRDEIGFSVSGYDPKLPLSIDPVLESSTFVGGSGDDRIVGTNGAGGYAGMTASIDFPNSIFGRRRGMDVIVRNVNGFGAANVVVIGGSGDEQVTGVSFAYNSVAVVGYTDSKDLPTNLSNSAPYQSYPIWQQNYAGGATDGFVLWVGAQSNSPYSYPLFLSYFGTPGEDRITAISNPYGGQYALTGWTNGSGLPVASNLLTGQTSPAGGVDGFVVQLYFSLNSAAIYGMTYLGGSGDDRPLGVYLGFYGGLLGYYVTGETTSSDFPLANPISSLRAGSSDAFVARLTLDRSGFSIVDSTLLGGSGTDRGVAITSSRGNILVAGVTSSADLPVVNPTQAAYGGGPSDAFLAELPPDLSKLVGLTWFGGSGEDEAIALTADTSGNVYMAGWTASQDLPVRNAVQPQYGGGPDDGFLVHVLADRTLYAATYYGGSGSDRVYGLSVTSDLTVWLAGQTTSTDLPLQKASQATLRGASDGFLAQISAPIFGTFRLIGAKGFRGSAPMYIGMRNGDASTVVTVTSSDPASVLVAADSKSSGQAAATIPPTANYVPAYRTIYIDCLVARGGADLTLSAPGYVSQIAHADCYPAQVQTSYTSYNSLSLFNINAPVFSLWGGPITIRANLVAVNPDLPADVGYLYSTPGSSTVVQVSSSSPSVGTPDPPTINFDTSNPADVLFQPLALGDTLITFSSPKLDAPGTQPIKVASPLTAPATDIWIAGGFQNQLPGVVWVGRTAPAFTLTATSQDPSRLVVSDDGTQPGSASATTKSNGGLYLQALDSTGDVPLTLSIDGFDPVTTTVHLSTPMIGCSGCVSQSSLGVQETLYVTPLIRAAGAPLTSLSPNPGAAPVRFSLQSSDPSVVTLSDPVDFKPGTFQYARLSVTGAAVGNATVTLKATGGIPTDPLTAGPTAVTVVSKPLRMADLDLGKDLAGIMTLSLPVYVNPQVPITLTVADPSLALLASSPQGAGQRQVTYTTTETLNFYIQGLSDAGQTTVTASVPGWGSVTATVTLAPSGFGWNSDSYTTTLYASSYTSSYVSAFLLDRATMLPLGTQALRGGVTPTIKLANANPGVATTVDSIATASCTACGVTISPKSVGSTTLGIVQPPGFSTPAIRQSLAVTVLKPSVTANDVYVGKDLQSAIQYGVPGSVSQPLTVTSSDPSKVVFSTDLAVPGSASVTVATDSRKTIYAQALDSQGSVAYTASTAGFNDATGKVQLLAVGAGLALSQSGYPSTYSLQGSIANTSTQSPVTPISLGTYTFDVVSGQQYGYTYGLTFRPGVEAPRVEVRSSDANVGTILRGPAQLSFQGTPTVDFKPLAPGDSDVTVVQPPGWITPPVASKISFHVAQPGFSSSNLLMGKDTYTEFTASLLGYVTAPLANVPVTITSSDPSRVMVSSSADSPAGASVTKTLIAGKTATDTFSIHALDNHGLIPLKVSAPGYSDGTIMLALSDTYFSFNTYTSSAIRAVIQNGPQNIGVAFQASSANLPQGVPFQTAANLGIRPGVSIVLNVRTSDAGVLAVDNPQVVLTAGRTNVTAAYRPVSPGSAVLTLEVPSGYLSGTNVSINVNVESAKLNLGGYSTFTVGRDLQVASSVSAETPFKLNTAIVLTSSDPSQLLLSASATAPGQTAIGILAPPNASAQYWVQALGDSGTATISATAEGYQAASLAVNLAPVAAVFTYPSGTQTLYTNSPPQAVSVGIGPLNSSLVFTGNYQGPRPGVDLTVGIRSSDNTVITPNVTSLHFTDANGQQAQVRPVGVGTAILSLDKLPNGIVPASGGQIVFDVAEPDLMVPNLTLGRDLQAPLQVKLASRLPAPATDIALTVYMDYYSFLALSNDPAVAGSASSQSITVILPAGQHLSRPFYVQALTGNFTLGLRVTGGSYTAATSTVTLASGMAFVFKEAAQTQPINLAAGTTTAFTVTPALLPLGTALPAGATIRAGATAIPVAVNSDTPSVLTVTPVTVTFKSGDAQATVNARGIAAGRARLSLSGPASYQFGTAQSVVVVQVK